MFMVLDACERYVNSVVNAIYPNDLDVLADLPLQAWLIASKNPLQGNVAGLEAVIPMDSRAKLKQLLSSLIYRVSVHGVLRLLPVANPAMSFIGNFPPCLEDSRIPSPADPNETGLASPPPPPFTTAELLEFLPKTGTMGKMIDFLFGFAYTDTYESFIPPPGVNGNSGADLETHPFFGPAASGCDAALQIFRGDIKEFIDFFMQDSNAVISTEMNSPSTFNFQPTPAQVRQWELGIEM